MATSRPSSHRYGLPVPTSGQDFLLIYETSVVINAPNPFEMEDVWTALNFAYMGKAKFDSSEEPSTPEHEDAHYEVRRSITATLYVGIRTDGTRVVLGVKSSQGVDFGSGCGGAYDSRDGFEWGESSGQPAARGP